MSFFEDVGEAVLLAEQGHRELGDAVVVAIRRALAEVRSWLSAMPTTLPPTDSFRS